MNIADILMLIVCVPGEKMWTTPEVVEEGIDILKAIKNRTTTYGDIFEEFCKKFPNANVKDFRPASPLFIPQLLKDIPYAIIIWLDDGSEVIYLADREVDE